MREYFDAQTFSLAYSKLKDVYEGSDSDFVRLLLADFILDFFPSDDPKAFFVNSERREFFQQLEEFRKSLLLTRMA